MAPRPVAVPPRREVPRCLRLAVAGRAEEAPLNPPATVPFSGMGHDARTEGPWAGGPTTVTANSGRHDLGHGQGAAGVANHADLGLDRDGAQPVRPDGP